MSDLPQVSCIEISRSFFFQIGDRIFHQSVTKKIIHFSSMVLEHVMNDQILSRKVASLSPKVHDPVVLNYFVMAPYCHTKLISLDGDMFAIHFQYTFTINLKYFTKAKFSSNRFSLEF